MKTPAHWQNKNVVSSLLTPLGVFYGALTALRLKLKKGFKASVPVICVGNITAGGVGKTPVSIALAQILQSQGKNPFFISRGYGGKLNGILVDPKKHSPQEVGDEPLMLSFVAPTVVAHDRGIAAQIAIKNGADILVMDDGFQNPSLKKDVSFLVFNGEIGIGNGKIIPAGPLRERLHAGLKRADAVIFIGNDKSSLLKQLHEPIFKAEIVEEKPKHFDTKVIAFAGIGYPQKFYNSLLKCGLTIANAYSFPDHHFYTKHELKEIIKKAQKKNLPIYTTSKDFVKIPASLQQHFNVLKIKAEFDNLGGILNFLKEHHVV